MKIKRYKKQDTNYIGVCPSRDWIMLWQNIVEQLFFAKNAKTAMDVGQARGVILVTLFDANIPITEATPMQVKQSVVGYGKADKLQIQHMVALQLGLKNKKMQDDMADALAIALTVGYVVR